MATHVETRVYAPKSMVKGVPVPPALAAAYERPGYTASLVDGSDPPELLVKRAGKMNLSNDSGALAPHVDHPFEPQELRNLAAIAATFDDPDGEE